jgi:hypothetical protein
MPDMLIRRIARRPRFKRPHGRDTFLRPASQLCKLNARPVRCGVAAIAANAHMCANMSLRISDRYFDNYTCGAVCPVQASLSVSVGWRVRLLQVHGYRLRSGTASFAPESDVASHVAFGIRHACVSALRKCKMACSVGRDCD